VDEKLEEYWEELLEQYSLIIKKVDSILDASI
jgi:hypothetical protein